MPSQPLTFSHFINRYWEASKESAAHMNADNGTIKVKINVRALEATPKRNSAPGTGRQTQASNLAGSEALVTRLTVGTYGRMGFYIIPQLVSLNRSLSQLPVGSGGERYVLRMICSTALLGDCRFPLVQDPPKSIVLQATCKWGCISSSSVVSVAW